MLPQFVKTEYLLAHVLTLYMEETITFVQKLLTERVDLLVARWPILTQKAYILSLCSGGQKIQQCFRLIYPLA